MRRRERPILDGRRIDFLQQERLLLRRRNPFQGTTFHTSGTVLKERGGSKAAIGKEHRSQHQGESESNWE